MTMAFGINLIVIKLSVKTLNVCLSRAQSKMFLRLYSTVYWLMTLNKRKIRFVLSERLVLTYRFLLILQIIQSYGRGV